MNKIQSFNKIPSEISSSAFLCRTLVSHSRAYYLYHDLLWPDINVYHPCNFISLRTGEHFRFYCDSCSTIPTYRLPVEHDQIFIEKGCSKSNYELIMINARPGCKIWCFEWRNGSIVALSDNGENTERWLSD